MVSSKVGYIINDCCYLTLCQGHVRTGLYPIEDERVDIGPIVHAAEAVVALMTPHQRKSSLYHVDSPEWRTWSNPEFLLSNKGMRLDEISSELRQLVLNILQTTLSPEGYDKAISAMRLNHFLGELVHAPAIMNEASYNFCIFGQPSKTKFWGFSFYGHHLCLNVALYRRQIFIAPWFTGAEPNLIDEGPYKGTQILQREEMLGLQLMQSLKPDQQMKAQVYKHMKDPAMPFGRWNHDDQRHLCGAYRDNRVVPYEGVLVSEMTGEQQGLVKEILNEYLLYLPHKARERQLDRIMSWFHETYWSWIGDFGDDRPFYYRIQSPVIIVEFDHHSGVFLTNSQPRKFHIHTLLRMPNAGDYGAAIRPLIALTPQEYMYRGEDK